MGALELASSGEKNRRRNLPGGGGGSETFREKSRNRRERTAGEKMEP